MAVKVGVVAIQGDFQKHEASFLSAGVRSVSRVREASDLEGLTHLVLPGGESTTVGLLMDRFGLGLGIKNAVGEGLAVWGTCMGMIVMAREVEGRDQFRLGILDVTVRRNAFGAQIHSFEDEVVVNGMDTPVTAVFIRAPVVTSHGSDVQEIATYEGKIVAVRQGKLLGTSFHPELTGDDRMHKWFITL